MSDAVNHPSHYNQHPSGVECLQIVRHMNFNLGNVVKYIWRHGVKPDADVLEDLKKARFYLDDEIKRLEEQVEKNLERRDALVERWSSKEKEIQSRAPGEDGVIRVTPEEMNLVSSLVIREDYIPPWEDYNKMYKWWAVDSTDRAYFFSEKPLFGDTVWSVSGDGLFRFDEYYNHELKDTNWKETLRERPASS